jgi:hypothetical protein
MQSGFVDPKVQSDIDDIAGSIILPMSQYVYGLNIRAEMLNLTAGVQIRSAPAFYQEDRHTIDFGQYLIPLDEVSHQDAKFYLLCWGFVPCPPRLDGANLWFAQDYLSNRVNQVIVPRQDPGQVAMWLDVMGMVKSPVTFPQARLVHIPAFAWRMTGGVVRMHDMTETRVTPIFLEAANLVFQADGQAFTEVKELQTIPHQEAVTRLAVPENSNPVMLYNVKDVWKL